MPDLSPVDEIHDLATRHRRYHHDGPERGWRGGMQAIVRGMQTLVSAVVLTALLALGALLPIAALSLLIKWDLPVDGNLLALGALAVVFLIVVAFLVGHDQRHRESVELAHVAHLDAIEAAARRWQAETQAAPLEGAHETSPHVTGRRPRRWLP
ncbi:hypothetical protein ACXR8F_21305 [Terrabacter sp. AAH1]